MQELAPTPPRVGLVLQYLQERPTSPQIGGNLKKNLKGKNKPSHPPVSPTHSLTHSLTHSPPPNPLSCLPVNIPPPPPPPNPLSCLPLKIYPVKFKITRMNSDSVRKLLHTHCYPASDLSFFKLHPREVL